MKRNAALLLFWCAGIATPVICNVADGVTETTRAEIITKDGTRQGYVEEKNGRLDVYDTNGKRLGHGDRQRDGSVQFYGNNGERTFQIRPSPGGSRGSGRGSR